MLVMIPISYQASGLAGSPNLYRRADTDHGASIDDKSTLFGCVAGTGGDTSMMTPPPNVNSKYQLPAHRFPFCSISCDLKTQVSSPIAERAFCISAII